MVTEKRFSNEWRKHLSEINGARTIKECLTCGIDFWVTPSEAIGRQFCSRSCSGKHKRPPASIKTRKKISDAQKKCVAEGRHSGWKSRSKVEPSYAEKFFIGVLDSRGIKYTREMPFAGFFIDFAFPERRLALEVDGRQHAMPDRIDADSRKDAALAAAEWSVVRVKWKNPVSKNNKEYIASEIRRFLTIYGYESEVVEVPPCHGG
jgi:very-short-patch-repair endonuclease